MDSITPVGAQIQPVDMTKGLNAYSTLLGIQQQKLGIQQQQQAIQGQAATVSQEQQKNNELQKAQQIAISAKNGNYRTPDGSLDRMKMADDLAAVGPYAAQYSSNFLSQANEIVQNQTAHQNLTLSRKKEIGDTFASLASDPQVDNTKVIDAIERLRQSHPNDPEFSRMLTSMSTHMPPTASPQDLQGLMGRWSAAATGSPQAAPSQVDTGAQILPGQTNKFTGQFTPAGNVNKKLGPTVVTPPGGVPITFGGVGGGPGGRGAGGPGKNMSGFPGPQPTDQDMKNFSDYSGNLNARVAVAADTVPRLNLVEAASQNIRTGGGSEIRANLAKKAQALGLPQSTVDAIAGGNLAQVQETEKMLFQTTMSGLRQAMQGDSAHVAEFQAAERVFPSIDTDPRARQQILGFIRDQSQRDFAEQQALNDARKKGTFNPVTWQGDYQQKLRGGQVPGVPQSQVPGRQKVSMQQVQDYATKHNLTLEQAKAHVTAHNFEIQ